VRAKAGFFITCFSAGSLVLCAGQGLRAQAAPPPSQSSGVSFQDSSNELSVAVGKTVLVDCVRPVTRVAIGLGDVAQASAITPTEIMVDGKTAGETSLIIWDDRGGRQFFNVTVRASTAALDNNMEAVRRELATELPGQPLKVTSENGVIYLRGTATDLVSSSRAVQIASTAGKVVNLLDVEVPKASPQILLKVRFASVDRSKATSLGINLFNLGQGNWIGGISTGQFSPPAIGGSSSTSGGGGSNSSTSGVSSGGYSAIISNEQNLFAFLPGLNAGATLAALETDGVVEVLAEPNIVASDGQEASFLAGGEFPYPVVQGTSAGGAGAVTIEFKDYGVRLNFIPTITPRGTIRLQVAPEVSALDFTNAVQISGFNVPALTTRKVKTEVELKDGATLVIGGLIDNRESQTFEKIPFLGDIPILGKFFQSKIKNRTNTELMVLVTPEIVAPLEAGEKKPEVKFPVKFLPPNSNGPMNQPDAKTAANTPAPSPDVIPVETLIQSMKPEKPLVIESGTGGFGGASTSTSGGGGGGAAGAAPSMTPP
jgi:pilus assembly protein CpaC